MMEDSIEQECQPLLRDRVPNPSCNADSFQSLSTGACDSSSTQSPVAFVYVVAGCAAINSCNVGFDIGVNSPAGILVQEDMHLSDVQLEMFMGKTEHDTRGAAISMTKLI